MSGITALSCEPFELWQVQRENPKLTGQALISVHDRRVLACSPLARAAGIEAGMSEAAARLRTQDLVVIEYDAASLAERWRQWLTDLYTVTSRIESLKMGRVLLQVDQADAQQLAEVYSVRAGRAASRELALLAALSALQGQARCIGEPRAFIDALPHLFSERRRSIAADPDPPIVAGLPDCRCTQPLA